MPLSTPIYGIDTSVFVWLLTGHPQRDFEKTAQALQQLLEETTVLTNDMQMAKLPNTRLLG